MTVAYEAEIYKFNKKLILKHTSMEMDFFFFEDRRAIQNYTKYKWIKNGH